MDPVAEVRQLYRQGRFSEAEVVARGALMGDEKNAHLLLLLGDVRSREGDLREAIDFFERCLPIHKDPARVRRRLLDAYLSEQQWASFLGLWQTLVGEEREHADQRIAGQRGTWLEMLESPEMETPLDENRWALITILFWLGEEEALERHFQKRADSGDRGSVELWRAAIQVVEGAGSASETREIIRELAAEGILSGQDVDVLERGVRAWQDLENPSQETLSSVAAWLEETRPIPAGAAGFVAMAVREGCRSRLDKTLRSTASPSGDKRFYAQMEALADQFPADANFLVTLGDWLRRQKREAGAIRCYEEALRLHKRPHRVRRRLFPAYLAAGQHGAALRLWQSLEGEEAALATDQLKRSRALLRRFADSSKLDSNRSAEDWAAALFFLHRSGEFAAAEMLYERLPELQRKNLSRAWRFVQCAMSGESSEALPLLEGLEASGELSDTEAANLSRGTRARATLEQPFPVGWAEALKWLQEDEAAEPGNLAVIAREALRDAIHRKMKDYVSELAKTSVITTVDPLLETFERLFPEDPDLKLTAGDLLRRVERYGDAALCYERALALHKDPDRVRRRLFGAYLGAARYADARRLWKQFDDDEPAAEEHLKAMRSRLRAFAESSELDAERSMADWEAALFFLHRAGEFAAAETLYERLPELLRGSLPQAWRFVHAASIGDSAGASSFLEHSLVDGEVDEAQAATLSQGLAALASSIETAPDTWNPCLSWLEALDFTTDTTAADLAQQAIVDAMTRRMMGGLRAAQGNGAVVPSDEIVLRLEKIFADKTPVQLAIGDFRVRLGQWDDADVTYERVLRDYGVPDRIRLRLLSLAVRRDRWEKAFAWREAIETGWGTFRAALACFDFTEALRLGRGLVRAGEPISNDWLPAYLGLLFELNLMGDALTVLQMAEASDPTVERHQFWLAWEGVEPKGGDVVARVDRFRGSTDAGIAWCLRALAALTSNETDVESLGEVLAARPEELVSPLSAIGVELSARLEAAWWQRRKIAQGTPLARRQWGLMPYFIRSRRKGKSFNVHVAR